MARKIFLADETLCRAGDRTFKEKLEIAQCLDKMQVDAIVLPEIKGAEDVLLYRAIAATTKNAALCVTVSAPGQVDKAFEAVSKAKNACLNVALPLSPMQMEYVAHKKPAVLPDYVRTMVSAAKEKAPVWFTAQDATRAEESLLLSCVSAAIDAKADAVIICDTVGQALPDEFEKKMAGIMGQLPELGAIRVGVSCDNGLSLALPCALAALNAGVSQVATCFGTQPDVLTLSTIVDKRGAALDMATGVAMSLVRTMSDRICAVLSAERSKTTPFETGVRTLPQGDKLTRDAGIAQVYAAIEVLGYDLTDEDKQRVFESFRTVAEKKPVTLADLDAIVASSAMQVPSTYHLNSYVINNGNVITATAHICLTRDGKQMEGISLGDGPIDAAFLAIEKITGHHFELDDFQIKAVTEGHEAMGDALVRLRAAGKLYAGRGTSTDIIGAAIRAYVNALNKIAWDEGK